MNRELELLKEALTNFDKNHNENENLYISDSTDD